ncbi:MAG: hypothetical protein ACOYXR_07425 [Nitrospirota bacterium]
MRRGVVAMALAGGLIVSSNLVSRAADGTVTVVSPKPNAVVGSDVTVTWAQEKVGRADHVHVFVDGGQMKPVTTGASTVVKGLSKGVHEVTVQAYSSDHEPLDAKASVTVKVE